MAPHIHREGSCGKKFGLMSIGSMQNGDDGAPRIALAMLPDDIRQSVCVMNFDVFTYFLSDCVGAHEGLIIVDTSSTDQQPGFTMVTDLLPVLKFSADRPNTCHAFAMLNELKLAKRIGQLPQTLLLFSIELGSKQWGNKLSPDLMKCMPNIVDELEALIRKSFSINPPFRAERAAEAALERNV